MTEKMESMWVWISEYPDGSVGTVGALIEGQHFPLVSRSRAVAEQLRTLAKAHAARSGQRVWLREFTAFKDHGEA